MEIQERKIKKNILAKVELCIAVNDARCAKAWAEVYKLLAESKMLEEEAELYRTSAYNINGVTYEPTDNQATEEEENTQVASYQPEAGTFDCPK